MFNLFHRTLGITILSLGSKAYPLCMVHYYSFVLVLECFLGVYTLQVDFSEALYILLALAITGLVTFAVVFEYAQCKLSELVYTKQ